MKSIGHYMNPWFCLHVDVSVIFSCLVPIHAFVRNNPSFHNHRQTGIGGWNKGISAGQQNHGHALIDLVGSGMPSL